MTAHGTLITDRNTLVVLQQRQEKKHFQVDNPNYRQPDAHGEQNRCEADVKRNSTNPARRGANQHMPAVPQGLCADVLEDARKGTNGYKRQHIFPQPTGGGIYPVGQRRIRFVQHPGMCGMAFSMSAYASPDLPSSGTAPLTRGKSKAIGRSRRKRLQF